LKDLVASQNNSTEAENRCNYCTTSIDSDFAELCLEDVLASAQRAKESSKKEFFIKNDLETFKSLMQSFVNKNNQKSEEALLHAHNAQERLVSYAKNEQNLADLYKLLLLHYQNVVERELPLHNYKLTLYFDNYFVDFEETLEDIKAQKPTYPTLHPYYNKLYKTTQDKLSILYRTHLKNQQRYKEEYITDRYKITQINADKKYYHLEATILLDDFKEYGTIFLEALQASGADKEKFLQDITKLQERFELK